MRGDAAAARKYTRTRARAARWLTHTPRFFRYAPFVCCRQAFGGAFDKGTGGLYSDKEVEKKEKEARKREEDRLRREKEEREEKRKKREWEDECVSRMAKSEVRLGVCASG